VSGVRCQVSGVRCQVPGDRCQGRAEGRSDKAVGRKSKAIQDSKFQNSPRPSKRQQMSLAISITPDPLLN